MRIPARTVHRLPLTLALYNVKSITAMQISFLQIHASFKIILD